MAGLAIVIIDNAGLVLTRARVLLVSVYVYRTAVIPIGRASLLMLTAIVSPRVRRHKRYTLLPLLLLSSFELPVVDCNSSVYIRVKRLGITIGLNKLVFNVVLESIVKPSFERVGSLVNSERELSELQGILDG